MELQTLPELFRKAGELVRSGKRAKDDKDLLPLLQVGILDDVTQIVGDN